MTYRTCDRGMLYKFCLKYLEFRKARETFTFFRKGFGIAPRIPWGEEETAFPHPPTSSPISLPNLQPHLKPSKGFKKTANRDWSFLLPEKRVC